MPRAWTGHACKGPPQCHACRGRAQRAVRRRRAGRSTGVHYLLMTTGAGTDGQRNALETCLACPRPVSLTIRAAASLWLLRNLVQPRRAPGAAGWLPPEESEYAWAWTYSDCRVSFPLSPLSQCRSVAASEYRVPPSQPPPPLVDSASGWRCCAGAGGMRWGRWSRFNAKPRSIRQGASFPAVFTGNPRLHLG